MEAFNASTEAKSAKDEVKQKIHSINRVRKIESFIENYQSPKDYDEFDNAVIQANILINELDREVFKTTMVDID